MSYKLGDKIERNGKKWRISKVGRKEARADLLNNEGTNSVCHHGFIIYQPTNSLLCHSINCKPGNCFVSIYLKINNDNATKKAEP